MKTVGLEDAARLLGGLPQRRIVQEPGRGVERFHTLGVGDIDHLGRVRPLVELPEELVFVGRGVGHHTVRVGDVVIALRGTRPKFGLVTRESDGAVALNPNVLIARHAEWLTGEYLRAVLDSRPGREQFTDADGALEPQNRYMLSEVRIPRLTSDEQAAYLARIRGVESEIAELERRLDRANRARLDAMDMAWVS